MRIVQRISLISLVLLSLIVNPFLHQDCHAASIATLRGVAGAVDIMRGGALPAIQAKEGDQVSSGDLIRTKSNAFAEVVYHDGTVLKVAPRSRIDIGEHFSGSNQNGSEVKLARGKVQAIVDLSKAPGTSGAKKFEIRTPNAIAGVRGTNFIVSHQQGVTGVLVSSGSVYSFNPRIPNQIVNLAPGTVTTISGNAAPSKPRPARGNEVQRMEQGLTKPAEKQSNSSENSVSGSSVTSGGGLVTTASASTSNETGGSPLTEGKNARSEPTIFGPDLPPLQKPDVLKPTLPPLPPSPPPPPPPPPSPTRVNVNVNVRF